MIEWFRKDVAPIFQLLIVFAVLSGLYDIAIRLVTYGCQK